MDERARGAIGRLRHPAREARVNTRWWWYGGAVEKREVRRQLEAMRDAGIGGVEIQFLYPLDFDDPAAGQVHADFFSPAFFDVLDFTLSCAKEMDIDVDLTLGSGWPFGGSFVEDTMAPDILVPLSHDATGPCDFSFDYTACCRGDRTGCALSRGGRRDGRRKRPGHHRPGDVHLHRNLALGQQVDVAVPEGPTASSYSWCKNTSRTWASPPPTCRDWPSTTAGGTWRTSTSTPWATR
jgi:hypothetical protein